MDTLTHLCTLYKTLSSTDQHTLLKFAEFLHHSSASTVERGETADTEIGATKKIVVKSTTPSPFVNTVETVSPPSSIRVDAPEPSSLPLPIIIPRNENETIVGAIRRLSASYPMLEKNKLLHEANALMTEHIMQGRDVDAVIDELDVLFAKHYEKYRTTQGT